MAGKRKRKDNGPSGFVRFKNAARNSRGVTATTMALRAIVSPADVEACVAWLWAHPKFDRTFVLKTTPRDYRDLHRYSALDPLPIQSEIAWAGALLRRYATTISGFLPLRLAFERAILSGDLSKAQSALSSVEECYGVSAWLIESTLLLLQMGEDGLERQKLYSAQVRSARAIQDVFNYIVYYLSQRNEPDISAKKFIERTTLIVESWPSNFDQLKPFARYRLQGMIPKRADDISSVLRNAAMSCIIDMYEAFTACATGSLDARSDIQAAFRRELLQFGKEIDDLRLAKLLYLSTYDARWLEQTLNADYAISQCLDVDPAKAVPPPPTDRSFDDDLGRLIFTLRGMFDSRLDVRSSATLIASALHTPGILSQAVLALGEVITVPDDHEAVRSVARLALNGALRPYGALLSLLLVEYTTSEARVPTELKRLDFIMSPYLDVRHVDVMDFPEQYVAVLGGRHRDLVSLNIERLKLSNAENGTFANIATEIVAEAQLERANLNNDNTTAEAIAASLISSASLRLARKAKRSYARSVLAQGKMMAAIHAVVDTALHDPTALRLMPLVEVANALTKAHRKALAPDISLSILFDLYTRNVSGDLAHFRRHAYQDFLKARAFTRPSQLRGQSEDVDAASLIYYLRNVCVPEVMQMSLAFQGSRDVEDERLAVLSMLSEVDKDNSKLYEGESKEILRRQTITSGIRHAELSKIDIDEPAIVRWAQKNLKEGFTRYQALRRIGIGDSDEDLVRILKEYLETANIATDRVFFIPQNEAFELLLALYSALLTECANDPERGLECFLSLRIRHGTLSGQLRHPLVVHEIITAREGGGASYQPNEYWRKRLRHLSPRDIDDIDDRLKAFSQSYDDFIEHISNDLVQIRSERRPEGLFQIDAASTILFARLLAQELTVETPFEEFLELFFSLFWKIVDPLLTSARLTVDEVLKPRMTALFRRLETEIDGLGIRGSIFELENAIRTSHTLALQALERVKDWFKLAAGSSEPSYTLEQLIDIGYGMVRKIHPEFDPKLDLKATSAAPLKGALKPFSDIFFNIFENIWHHSGSRHPWIEVRGDDDGKRIAVTVRNEITEERDTQMARDKVANIKDLIAQGKYREAVSSEGGSGFVKMHRILDERDAFRGSFSFDHESPGRFVVSFAVDWPLRDG